MQTESFTTPGVTGPELAGPSLGTPPGAGRSAPARRVQVLTADRPLCVAPLLVLELALFCALLAAAGAWPLAGTAGVLLLALAVVAVTGRPPYVRPAAIVRRALRRAGTAPPGTDPALVPLAEWLPGLTVTDRADSGGRRIGVAGDGTFLTSLLELSPTGGPFTERPGALPASVVAEAMDGGNVRPCGVRVVRHARPRPGGGTMCRTWLAVTLRPAFQEQAVALRGGGIVGAHRALTRATDLMAARMTEHGVHARVLDAREVVSVLELTAGARPFRSSPPGRRTRESARSWWCDGRPQATFRLGTGIGLGPLLARLDDLPARAVVAGLHLRPVRRGAVDITARVRLVCDGPGQLDTAARRLAALARNHAVRLVRLDQDQAPGALATLPLGGVS